jgi:hypothetical protein
LNGFANTEGLVLADAHEVIFAEDGAVFKDFLKNSTGKLRSLEVYSVESFLKFSVSLWLRKLRFSGNLTEARRLISICRIIF